MQAEEINFKIIEVGKTISAEDIENEYDAIVICTGASVKRELSIPGSSLRVLSKQWISYLFNNKAVTLTERNTRFLLRKK